MAKGSSFERWLCAELSKWWTQDLTEPRDDCFWRTSNSGGRATSRTKSGQRTHGQYGDICATDPIGQPLIDLLTIEAKRGYSGSSFADLIDKPAHAKKQQYEVWFEKAQKDSEAAGSFGWLLITRRDRRVPLVFMPKWTVDIMNIHQFDNPAGAIKVANKGKLQHVYFCTLKEWMEDVKPEEICRLALLHKRSK